ncbi:uncharacterized protein MONOS_3150 [Monocercomonoides exilis]|uniref:uncharacterized protein n=1 Tax=Monocercomonoides exilis TaxID=2049356 RepID=UPI00355A7F33|nr:hypothetical protein MONOS_3150 [Monocercomonoides exilis]|eukprot:MONOS_3150.1-p1 / transcript=MONOS_3150.1 / gene=MONOS_3150 / organism=Monocercomonoides_exilis_PA203 / gene_product=unspecified product / transcript_product=unspecified product / location=Mono_scaffold00071:145387-146094(+) / protein_length=134 / sequence_SO=supercontig / SO=protein_coding / is_pseudo=false
MQECAQCDGASEEGAIECCVDKDKEDKEAEAASSEDETMEGDWDMNDAKEKEEEEEEGIDDEEKISKVYSEKRKPACVERRQSSASPKYLLKQMVRWRWHIVQSFFSVLFPMAAETLRIHPGRDHQSMLRDRN